MKKHMLWAALLLLGTNLLTQTPIQGIINDYSPVTAIQEDDCQTMLTLSNAGPFAIGDRVLLIQMKGASISTSNDNLFGQILDYEEAGNWELGIINDKNGANILLDGSLSRAYDPTQTLQLVRVPEYQDATVTGTLLAQAWDGSSGGILALWVTGTLNLDADIDLTGQGFRGGTISNNPDGGCGTGSTDFFYPLTQPGGSWTTGGAEKGEGIITLPDNMRAGKGPQASGGGGGNKHNTGGGGGGNFTEGGKGGNALQGCPVTDQGGLGGKPLAPAYVMDRLFLGGGGGCGDDNNNVGSVGVDGGGVAFIKAGILNGNGFEIRANGLSQTTPGTGIADGGGGGGAGGTVFLDVPQLNGPLTIQVNGGDGGDQQPFFGCVGPGGGGGAGTVVTTNSPPFPGNILLELIPGQAGQFLALNFPCTGTSYGAEDGDSNFIGPLFDRPLYFTSPGTNLMAKLGADTTLCPGEVLALSPGVPGASYLWQDGSTNSFFLVQGPGLYFVTITLDSCQGTDSIQVDYSPSVPGFFDTTICQGETWILPIPGGDTLVFSGDNLPDTLTPVLLPGQSQFGCDSTLLISVSLDSLIMQSTFTNPICDVVPTGSIDLSISSGSLPLNILWNDPNLNGNSNPANLAAGTYAVTVSNPAGCITSDSINLENMTAITVVADTLIHVSCFDFEDGQIQLNIEGGQGPFSYAWSPNIPGNPENPINLGPGIYNLTVTDFNGCIGSYAGEITEPGALTLNLEPSLYSNFNLSCSNSQDGYITASGGNGTLPYSYNWNTGQTTDEINNLGAGSYSLTLSDANNCTITDSLSLLAPDPLQFILSATGLTCSNDATGAIHIDTITGGSPPYLIQLNQGPLGIITTFQDLLAGTYTVGVQDLNGCEEQMIVLVDDAESFLVSLGSDLEIDLGQTITLYPQTIPATPISSISWLGLPAEFGNCTILPDCLTPSFIPLEASTVSVVVTNPNGCIAEDEIEILVKPIRPVFFPNIFSPNGDGANDIFYPQADPGVAIRVRSFQIYNRWGGLIFANYNFPVNDPGYGWAGDFRSKRLDPGVFVYVAQVEFIDGQVIQFRGDVTLQH